MKITHGFIGPRNAQIISLNNAQIWIWPPDYNGTLACHSKGTQIREIVHFAYAYTHYIPDIPDPSTIQVMLQTKLHV